ncbi:MAG: alpha/beta hydrolase [Clostridiales bacterium]|nr:alpha/beta hydrolase [Clostridiales bacterium]
MEKEILYIPAEDVELYCEKRGSGPLLIIMPDGTNDCEPYAHIAELMADEFTVITFDPRGGSRSMPTKHQKVTAELLADDIAAIIRYMDMGKASLFGCSSGGQGVLMAGVKYPELVKNVMPHEAALMMDDQIPGVAFSYIQTFNEVYGPHLSGANVNPFFAALYVSVFPEKDYDAETNERLAQNAGYWMQYYLGVQDSHSYTKEELAKIPACDFTVGCWTPAWHPYANIETAKRGGFEYTWLPCAHYPVKTCPDVLAEHLKKTIHKYD